MHSNRTDWIGLFDDVAETYDQIVPFFSAFANLFVDWISPIEGAHVLDLATGRGAIISSLIARNDPASRLVGIDLSEQMLLHTSRQITAPNATFQLMSAEQLEFPDASFDLVTCGFALHLFANPALAIAEVFRVLRPGGVFAFSTPGPTSGRCAEVYDALTREFAKRIAPAARDESRLRAEPMLSEAGFIDLETTEVEVHLPVASPEEFWISEMSHGRRRFFAQLSDEDRNELRSRLIAFLEDEQKNGGITLDRGAIFRKARKPVG